MGILCSPSMTLCIMLIEYLGASIMEILGIIRCFIDVMFLIVSIHTICFLERKETICKIVKIKVVAANHLININSQRHKYKLLSKFMQLALWAIDSSDKPIMLIGPPFAISSKVEGGNIYKSLYCVFLPETGIHRQRCPWKSGNGIITNTHIGYLIVLTFKFCNHVLNL